MDNNNIKKWIEQNADAKTASFAASLVPGLKHKMYGIKLPILSKKAKELVEVIDEIGSDSCEEILLKAYAIGYIKNVDLQIAKVLEFVPEIDNWMVCDSFCSALKNAKKYQQKYWLIVKDKAKSKLDYEQRFAFVMMLKFFCNENYVDQVLEILVRAKPKIWDTKQGLAWAMAECFIRFREKTEPCLSKLLPEIYQLTKRKILDSKRVGSKDKQKLRNKKFGQGESCL